MPDEPRLKRTVQRKRGKTENVPAEPSSLQELQLPQKYRELSNGKKFLQHDSGPSRDRFMVFATEENLTLLGQCTNLFSDGTFSTAPSRLFYQLYTIHGEFSGTVIPLVYAFLPDKSEATYTRLVTTLQNLVSFTPTSWLTDFERAAINVIDRCYPGTSKGCFFHLQQCLWRKVFDICNEQSNT